LAADTEAVEGAGDQFLAGAAFAEDQDVALVGATFWMSLRSSRILGDSPTI